MEPVVKKKKASGRRDRLLGRGARLDPAEALRRVKFILPRIGGRHWQCRDS